MYGIQIRSSNFVDIAHVKRPTVFFSHGGMNHTVRAMPLSGHSALSLEDTS
jgi:hypothetical protein